MVDSHRAENFASYSSRREKALLIRLKLNFHEQEFHELNLCATQRRTDYDNAISYIY